jgi:hypothetical protein
MKEFRGAAQSCSGEAVHPGDVINPVKTVINPDTLRCY